MGLEAKKYGFKNNELLKSALGVDIPTRKDETLEDYQSRLLQNVSRLPEEAFGDLYRPSACMSICLEGLHRSPFVAEMCNRRHGVENSTHLQDGLEAYAEYLPTRYHGSSENPQHRKLYTFEGLILLCVTQKQLLHYAKEVCHFAFHPRINPNLRVGFLPMQQATSHVNELSKPDIFEQAIANFNQMSPHLHSSMIT